MKIGWVNNVGVNKYEVKQQKRVTTTTNKIKYILKSIITYYGMYE